MNLGVALRLGRISNLPTVWSNALVGTVLAGGAVDLRLALVGLSLSLFYVGGMYLNDAFDRDFDARQRSSRPIPSGEAGAGLVFAAGFGMLLLGLALLLGIGWSAPVGPSWAAPMSGAALAAAVVAYNAWHKENPLSPALMGLCRVLVYLTAGLAVAASLPNELLTAAAMSFSYLVGLTYAAKHENLGRIGNAWPLLFLAVPMLYGLAISAASAPALVIAVAFVGWAIYALSFLLRRGRIDIPRAVVSLIAGISLLDAVLIAGHGRVDLAWAAVGCFALTLLLQRFVPGT